MATKLWRHGDVLIAQATAVPTGAVRQPTTTLVRGEVTGHSHRLADPASGTVWQVDSILYLSVLADETTLIHEEHHPITLPRGVYRVWQQREYTPQAIVRVVD